jgi:hypothetical protein
VVLIFPKDLPNLVFQRVRPSGLGFEAMQARKELPIHELDQVIARQHDVVVNLAVLAPRRGPEFPAVSRIENVGVFLAAERGLGGFVLLQGVEVFQEEQPGGLLGAKSVRLLPWMRPSSSR